MKSILLLPIVLGVAKTGLEHADDVCKVLTSDSTAYCRNSQYCYVKNKDAWLPYQWSRKAYQCGDKALFAFDDLYSEHVLDMTTPFLALHRSWAPRTDCGGFMHLFGKSIPTFMSSSRKFTCNPMELSALVEDNAGTAALRGVINMYRMFPLGRKVVLSRPSIEFMTQVEKAVLMFPIHIATDTKLTAAGADREHSTSLLLNAGLPAEEILLLKAQEPLNIPFAGIMDLLYQVHGHLASPPNLRLPRAPATLAGKVKNYLYSGVNRFYSKLCRRPTAAESAYVAASNADIQFRGRLGLAANELALSVLNMIDSMNSDTRVLTQEHVKYLKRVEGALIRKDQARENVYEDIIQTRGEWMKDHYKNILSYLVYLHSTGFVQFNNRTLITWA